MPTLAEALTDEILPVFWRVKHANPGHVLLFWSGHRMVALFCDAERIAATFGCSLRLVDVEGTRVPVVCLRGDNALSRQTWPRCIAAKVAPVWLQDEPLPTRGRNRRRRGEPELEALGRELDAAGRELIALAARNAKANVVASCRESLAERAPPRPPRRKQPPAFRELDAAFVELKAELHATRRLFGLAPAPTAPRLTAAERALYAVDVAEPDSGDWWKPGQTVVD